MKKFTYTLLLLFICTNLHTQTQKNKDKAEELLNDAIILIDYGYYSEAIEYLEEAQTLDPQNIAYPYEIAYANYKDERYSDAIEIGEKIKNHKDSGPAVYELLGNAYDMDGKHKKAISIYYEGLQKFPKSGRMYMEIGITYGRKLELDSAVVNLEKAIEIEPNFSSPYYHLSRIFSFSTERIWTLIYGELFINLEKDTKRTLEISKLLYKTYNQLISFKGDTTKVTLSKISLPETQKFAAFFELSLTLSSYEFEKKFSIEFLNKVRTKFIDLFNESENFKNYKIILFEWHKKLIEKGYFEFYNYWLFNAGKKSEFKKWYKSNETKFKEFDSWMGDNSLRIDSTNYFVRKMLKTE